MEAIKPYSCGICGKGFDKQADASLHLHSNHAAFVTFNNVTYREWLVGMAMQGFIASGKAPLWDSDRTFDHELISTLSIQQSDAVIAKLSEGK